MLIEVKVPILSESISEAVLVAWHKHAGDFVAEDENLVDLETDKVVLEVVAPKDGVISEIKKGDGVVVSSDEVIAVIDTEAVNDAAANVKPNNNTEETNKENTKEEISDENTKPNSQSEQSSNNVRNLGPAVRKIVNENNIDPSQIEGTGNDGRITKGDVIQKISSVEKIEQRKSETKSEPSRKPVSLPIGSNRQERRVPMSRLRARVAERLKAAQNSAAILTTFNEVNMKPIMDLRNKYKNEFFARHDTKLGFMSFFTKACVESLKKFPIINASVDEQDIIYHGYYDIGIAIGSPRGLVVPILRDVDTMGFSGIEKSIVTYGQKAKDGKLALDDLLGGTFSITNGGVYGSMLSTPILNPPQSAILGMHNIQDRAIVENGEVIVRPMMYLALSYDHRIIDGQDAVMFLVDVKKSLEDPVRLMLDV